jgi:hypothetical protein
MQLPHYRIVNQRYDQYLIVQWILIDEISDVFEAKLIITNFSSMKLKYDLTFIAKPDGIRPLGQSNSVVCIREADSISKTPLSSGLNHQGK